MTQKKYSPGETVPESGLYEPVAPNGRPAGHEVTCVEGEPFPPTPKPGYKYVIRQPAKHK